MSRPLILLLTLTVPAVMSMTPASAPVRKDVLLVSIRGDSGSAQHYTVTSDGLHVFSRRHDLRLGGTAPDTLTVVGTGVVEIASADSGKAIVADVQVISSEVSDVQRFSGRTLKVSRKSVNDGYTITDR